MNCAIVGLGRVHAGVWCALAILLLAGNGLAASLASPFVLIHRYDGVQYQLLARNRLCGHYEVGDEAHTVHEEGRHPMWRPGLVWIEEGLARCLGSVRKGAAAASALGTTFLELALLSLAWCCFGKKTFLFVLIGLLVPAVSSPFLELAVGQGPEVWAAAVTVGGLTVLVEALRRHSGWWTLAAGTIAGLAEWFRTGNLLLFAVPCAVYSLAALRQRNPRGFCLSAGALVAWVGMAALGELAAPSSVNKTVTNLWSCRVEIGGPLVTEELAGDTRLSYSALHYTIVPGSTRLIYSMVGYTLVPETGEINIDYVLRCSRGRSLLGFFREHAGEITRAYVDRLQQALTGGFRGLRQTTGQLVFVLFGVQLLLCLARREDAAAHTFAVAGAALAHYLGPVILLAGDEPTHYLLVAFPLFLLVAGRGAHRLVELVNTISQRRQPVLAQPQRVPWALVAVGLVVFVGMSVPFYRSAVQVLRDFQQQTLEEQAAVDALGLEGRKVACRNMCWFVDRKVHTILLPYATVPELETYARDHGIDGILVWEKESMVFFYATPYGSAAEFDRALQASALFSPPQASGTWRWYPVRPASYAKEQP